ncbi:heat shock 90-like protein [Arracacha virus 1]|uniref:Heat shock 90-like protein n=1 Tax=Arracacha virus 1 TaxID=2201042 RepID=A0A2U8JHA1_9CLOS|nr:heat shock 90-like protein [Arracacha virus 1]AWK68096.1 heat shock 90-like protein [Arracacha virus 1]
MTFVGYSWGNLFLSFFGEEDYKNYLSEVSGYTGSQLPVNAMEFRDGSTLSAAMMMNSSPGTPQREMYLLLTCERTNEWCSLMSLNKYKATAGVNIFSRPLVYITDAPTVGSKFSKSDVVTFLRRLGKDPAAANVEHCWFLSNSCGELIDANDTSKYSKIVNSGITLALDEEVKLTSKSGEYLAYAISLYDSLQTESQSGRKKLYDRYLSYVIKYMAPSNLSYHTPEVNPLLTGLLYDMCDHDNVYVSEYVTNLNSFRSSFLEKYLPSVNDFWEYDFLQPAPDERLIFPLDDFDLVSKIPSLNINDSTVLLGGRLKYVESIFTHQFGDDLDGVIDAVLQQSNPSIKRETLWVALFTYYGVYRTAKTRIVPRPEVFTFPPGYPSELTCEVNFSTVEKYFSDLQTKAGNSNVRRNFMGAHASEAFRTYKALGIGFPPVSALNIPEKYGYLNVDYYKQAKVDHLTDEEATILKEVSRDVDAKCTRRLVNSNPVNKSINKDAIRTAKRLPTGIISRRVLPSPTSKLLSDLRKNTEWATTLRRNTDRATSQYPHHPTRLR